MQKLLLASCNSGRKLISVLVLQQLEPLVFPFAVHQAAPQFRYRFSGLKFKL